MHFQKQPIHTRENYDSKNAKVRSTHAPAAHPLDKGDRGDSAALEQQKRKTNKKAPTPQGSRGFF
jgi:hypothetical protein